MISYDNIRLIVNRCKKMDSEELKNYFFEKDRRQKAYQESMKKDIVGLGLHHFDMNCDLKDHTKIIAFVLRAKYPETYKEIEGRYEKDKHWELTNYRLLDLGNGYMSVTWSRAPILEISNEKEEKDENETEKREQGQVRQGK